MNRNVGAEPTDELRVEAPDRFQIIERHECPLGLTVQHDPLGLNRPDTTQLGKLGH